MSFEIKRVYTENPYVDELVYYTKLLGIETVLKLQQRADNCETADSLKASGIYIACMENTMEFAIIPRLTRTCLLKAGVDPNMIDRCVYRKEYVPQELRDAVVKEYSKEYVETYEDLNPYYRMLHGLPAIGREDYVEDWIPPDGVEIDLSKPIHKMNSSEINILDHYGILDDIIAEDPVNREYMHHLCDKAIDYYTARRATRFDVLYIPDIDSDSIYKMYKDKLNSNKTYILRTVYSEAYNYGSDYYDNFIAVLIVLTTIMDIIARVQEFIARKEIFDLRSIQYIFKSNGVPFYEEIPLKYQMAMIKNLHTLLKYKSTKKCMVSICSLFGFSNIKIFKYYLLKDRRTDIHGNYIYAEDENGNEDINAEYELKFLKLPLEDDIEEYVRSSANYMNYDEVTNSDTTWDGGLDHNEVIKEILQQDFNIARTKYISIDSVYEIAKLSMQQSYFFNFLYSNNLDSKLTIQIPFIDSSREFKITDIFVFLTALGYYYNNVKDTIMDTQSKVLFINGFNFKADLSALATDIMSKCNDEINSVPDAVIEDANAQLNKFKIYNSEIPSLSDMMAMFVNNMEVRDALIKGMQEAENVNIYRIYKDLYDALMITELNLEFYKDPHTGDFYRDEDGDATYTEFLKHRDSTLYTMILEVQDSEDKASRNQYITNIIDSITWVLEEYINSNTYQGIYASIPTVSSDVVNQYIATVINFYKSYKIEFLGVNTIYTLDDKIHGIIKLADCVHVDYTRTRTDRVDIAENINSLEVDISPQDRVELVEVPYIYRYDTATILRHPSNKITKVGDTIYFNILVAGDNLTYEWQYKHSAEESEEWTSIANSDADSIFILVDDTIKSGHQVRCIINERDEGNNIIHTIESNPAYIVIIG